MTRTLDAEVHLRNKDGALRAGMYGRGAIILAVHPRAVVVPVSAVQITRQQRYVFVVKGSQVFQRMIKTGEDGETWLEVVEGLKAGDKVVTAGAEGLADATVVRVSEGVDPYTGARVSPGAKPK
jgi:RND family efflux transporter MFP subunit